MKENEREIIMEKSFHMNQLDSNHVQIYGLVNGCAVKRAGSGEMVGSYSFSIKFFDSKNRLIKVSNNDKDGSVRSLEHLEKRITEIYNKEFLCKEN